MVHSTHTPKLKSDRLTCWWNGVIGILRSVSVFPSASDRFESSLRHTRFWLLIAHHTSTISNILLTQCHNSSQYFHFLLLLFLIFLIFLLYIFVVGSIFTNKHFVSITLQNQKLINTLRCFKIASISMRMLFIGITKRVLD